MIMFLGTRVPAEELDDDDWDTTPVARGPSLSRADEQFIDLLVGESDSETETESREDDTSVSEASTERSENRSEEEIPSLGELATDHLTRATTFLGRSVRRVSGSFTLYPSALVHTRERASSLIGETVQQTKALSSTILDMTVNRAMRLSSEAINVANEKTRATLSSAGAALSPPRVEHENGRVKHLPSALADRITHNPPDLSRLVLHANEYTSFACSLSGEACGCFSTNTTIRDLYLYGWNVDDDGMAKIAHCTSLRRLRVVENAVTDAGAEAIIQNAYLRELDLSKGEWPMSTAVITAVGAAHFASLRDLTILRLNGHCIGDKGVEALASSLPMLRVLGVAQNSITDVGASLLVKLTSMTYLDLSRNTVGAPGALALSKHPSLLLLNVAHNPIDDVAFAHLLSSPRIAFLSTASCTATAAALAALPKSSPLVALDVSNSNAMLAPALERLHHLSSLTFCDARLAHTDTALNSSYWHALRHLEDQVTSNLQTVLARRRKIVFLFISLARQRRASAINMARQVLPLDLLLVILGFASPSDYGKTPLQLQSLCRWIFRNLTEVDRRLKERRSLHVIERCYYSGVPESFRFAEETSGSCAVS